MIVRAKVCREQGIHNPRSRRHIKQRVATAAATARFHGTAKASWLPHSAVVAALLRSVVDLAIYGEGRPGERLRANDKAREEQNGLSGCTYAKGV